MSAATTLEFPTTLRTATPAEGHALAQQLATRALAERSGATSDIASHLASSTAPSREALTAAYFQSIAAANSGWPR